MTTKVKTVREKRSAITVRVADSALREAAEILSKWETLDPSIRQRYQAAWNKPQAEMQPLIDAVKAAERLTQRDFAIRINMRA